MSANLKRRKLCKSSGIALALIPIAAFSGQARASTNAAVRAALKYQATPQDNMQCASCVDFISGKTDTAPGGCKVIPGDDEISPDGYCTAWNTM